MDQHGIQEESKQRNAKKDDLEILKNKARIKKDNEMQMRVFIWAMETEGKLKEVAKYLKIDRERMYNIFRKMKKEMRMHNVWKIASRSVENKKKAELVEKLKDFVRDNAHSFYTVNDARDYLTGGTEDNRYPSRSTVQQMLKKEWGLSFKKVNVRFKQRWEPEDLMKARHIWACLWLFENNWALIHVVNST